MSTKSFAKPKMTTKLNAKFAEVATMMTGMMSNSTCMNVTTSATPRTSSNGVSAEGTAALTTDQTLCIAGCGGALAACLAACFFCGECEFILFFDLILCACLCKEGGGVLFCCVRCRATDHSRAARPHQHSESTALMHPPKTNTAPTNPKQIKAARRAAASPRWRATARVRRSAAK